MKRRELEMSYEIGSPAGGQESSGIVLFREVLPSDPDPEWVDELILRAAAVCRHHKKWSWDDISLLENHIAKRGTK